MTTPLPTTTIAIRRPPDAVDDGPLGEQPTYQDPYDPDDERGPQVVASGIAAHIGHEIGKSGRTGGNTPTQGVRLSADLCDLRKDDFVDDETTGIGYRVDWVFDRVSAASPGLDRTRAQLVRLDGATPNVG